MRHLNRFLLIFNLRGGSGGNEIVSGTDSLSGSASSAEGVVGIENMSHFYALFKRFSGCTPKQFQTGIGRAGKRP